MTEKKSNIWAELAIAFLAYLAVYYITGIVYLSAIAIAVPAVFVAARRGLGVGLAFFAACVAASYYLAGFSALIAGAAVAPFVLITAPMIRNRKSAWDSLVLSCGAALLSAGIVILYYYLISGKDILSYATDSITARIKVDDDFASGLYWMLAPAGQSIETLYSTTMDSIREYLLAEAQLSQIKAMISTYLPQIIISYVLYGGICAYFIPRAIAKKTGGEVGRVPRFSQLSLPKQQGVYILVLLGAALIPILFSIENLIVPAEMLYSLTATVFAIEGVSFVSFLLGIKIKSKFVAAAIAVVAYGFLPTAVIFAGVFEQIVRIRDKVHVFRA